MTDEAKPDQPAEDLGELTKHLSLHAAQILVSKTGDKIRNAAYRLLHNAKAKDKALAHEGQGYEDFVVRQLYRATHALERAGWELHRRMHRASGNLLKAQTAQPFDELPEKNPNATDFSKFLPDIPEFKVPKHVVTELVATLKALASYLGQQGGHAPTGELLKSVKKAALLLEGVIEAAEKDAP